MNVAINGFGRIGRVFFRIAFERGVNIVAINDVHGADYAAYLLKYDSIYGRYNRKVEVKDNFLVVEGKRIKILSEREIEKLPWKKLGVDVVIEATGVFRDPKDAAKHVKNGAKYVLISAPAKERKPNITVVPGVNHQKLKKEHKIISVASCTTNCLVPVVHVLHNKFGIKRAFMTTVHAYTNDQDLHDGANKKIRRGRAAAINMIPTTTGANESVAEIIPELLGRIGGVAIRVPVAIGSLVDLVAELKKDFDVKAVNKEFKRAAENELKGILDYSEEELVSSDVVGTTYSGIVDGLSTQKDGNLVKILAWYDNEWGYCCRVVDVVKILDRFL